MPFCDRSNALGMGRISSGHLAVPLVDLTPIEISEDWEMNCNYLAMEPA
jgi:hypothetical protein